MKRLGDFYTTCINALCLGKKFWQRAVMREGRKRWGLKTFQHTQFCTAEEEMKHWIHTHTHTFRPAETQLKPGTLNHLHYMQKCLNTLPVTPGFICISILVWKLLVYSHHYQDQPNTPRLLSWTFLHLFLTSVLQTSNLTPQIRNRIKMPLDVYTSHITHSCTPVKE